MWEVTIILKSGRQIVLECREWEFNTDDNTGEFTGYNLGGMPYFETLEIVPSQIAAYYVKRR